MKSKPKQNVQLGNHFHAIEMIKYNSFCYTFRNATDPIDVHRKAFLHHVHWMCGLVTTAVALWNTNSGKISSNNSSRNSESKSIIFRRFPSIFSFFSFLLFANERRIECVLSVHSSQCISRVFSFQFSYSV